MPFIVRNEAFTLILASPPGIMEVVTVISASFPFLRVTLFIEVTEPEMLPSDDILAFAMAFLKSSLIPFSSKAFLAFTWAFSYWLFTNLLISDPSFGACVFMTLRSYLWPKLNSPPTKLALKLSSRSWPLPATDVSTLSSHLTLLSCFMNIAIDII